MFPRILCRSRGVQTQNNYMRKSSSTRKNKDISLIINYLKKLTCFSYERDVASFVRQKKREEAEIKDFLIFLIFSC